MRYVLMGGVALLVRLICAFELRGSPFFDNLFIDARVYHLTAEALASGFGFAPEPFWQPPGFPLFVAAIYALAGPHPFAVSLVQAVLGAASCILLFRVTDRMCGRVAAWVAWAAMAFYGPAIFFDTQVLNVSLAIFLLMVVLESLVGHPRISSTRAMIGGLGAGFGAITVGNLVVVGAFVAVALLVRQHFRRMGAVFRGGSIARWALPLFMMGFLAPIGGVAARNAAVSGEFVPISYNGGINFWIGNNAQYDTTVGIRPGRDWVALTGEPRRAGHTGFAAQSRYFVAKSLSWMREDPGAFARLQLRKAGLFLRGDESLRNQEIYPFRAESWVLRILLWSAGLAFPFSVLLSLAAVGSVVVLSKGGRQDAQTAAEPGSGTPPVLGMGFLWILGLIYATSVVAFFVTARYRLPVVPVLCVFAGVGGQALWSVWRNRSGARVLAASAPQSGVSERFGGGRLSGRQWAVATGAGALALAGSIWGLPPMPSTFNSDAHYDLGLAHQTAGRYDEARIQYERALELDSGNAEAKNNLAGLLMEQGQLDAALGLLHQVLERYPDDSIAHANLGFIYLRKGQPIESGNHYVTALEERPDDPALLRALSEVDALTDRLERERLRAAPESFLDAWVDRYREDPSNAYLFGRLTTLLPANGRGAELRDLERLRALPRPIE